MMRSTAVVAALLFWTATAGAKTKFNLGLVPAGGYHRDTWGFDSSVVGAAMFGDWRRSSLELGPRLEVGTWSFETIRLALGPSAHLAVEPLSLGLAAHLGYTHDRHGSALGVGARMLLGLRPYNHYGEYTATGGVLVGIDQWFAGGTSFLIGAELDAMWFSLPFLALRELFRG
jgi:hypothetical protein